MRDEPANHRSQGATPSPPPFIHPFIRRLHLFITRAPTNSPRHNPRSHYARLQRVPHPFTAERIHHSSRITDRDELARHFIVSQRSGHQTLVPEILSQRVPL